MNILHRDYLLFMLSTGAELGFKAAAGYAGATLCGNPAVQLNIRIS